MNSIGQNRFHKISCFFYLYFIIFFWGGGHFINFISNDNNQSNFYKWFYFFQKQFLRNVRVREMANSNNQYYDAWSFCRRFRFK